MTLNGHFSRPAETDPYANNHVHVDPDRHVLPVDPDEDHVCPFDPVDPDDHVLPVDPDEGS